MAGEEGPGESVLDEVLEDLGALEANEAESPDPDTGTPAIEQLLQDEGIELITWKQFRAMAAEEK